MTLVIFILLLVTTAYWLYRRQYKKHLSNDTENLMPPYSGGLFNDPYTQSFIKKEEDPSIKQRAYYLASSSNGDLTVLKEVYTNENLVLYREVLDKLIDYTLNSNGDLRTIKSFILKNKDLRSNARLAQIFIEEWKVSPTKEGFTNVLHITALSDDAAMFEIAVDAIVDCWRTENLPHIQASNLLALIESEYWVIAPEARQSGAGFLLKRRLVHLRRELKGDDPMMDNFKNRG
jgi:hypothetical protein